MIYDSLAHFMGLSAYQRELKTGKNGNPRLRNSGWIAPLRIRRLDLAQAACDQQKAIRALRHPPKTITKT
jgi:hypothetical protein